MQHHPRTDTGVNPPGDVDGQGFRCLRDVTSASLPGIDARTAPAPPPTDVKSPFRCSR